MADYDVTKLEDDIESLNGLYTILSRISNRTEIIRSNAENAADCESHAHASNSHSELINTIRFMVANKLETKHAETTSTLNSAINDLKFKKTCAEIEEREYKRLYGED
ncbi:MAG: hypothetical protein MJ112_01750 [Lachnospiraceae bacterium]|nr:hypothetical protein [Lachnospiraceae bacterium]